MNLYLRLSSISLLFFAGITACKKHSGEPVRDVNKLRISKITQSTWSNPVKEIYTNFFYDDQQRVDKIVIDNRGSVKYYYNGTDKKPYKASGGETEYTTISEIYYTYNAAGLLIHDSVQVAGTSPSFIRDYTYSPEGIRVTKTYFVHNSTGGISLGNSDAHTFEIKDNNFTQAIYHIAGPITNLSCRQSKYDDKINPLSKLNIAPVKVVEGINGYPDITTPSYCRNNIKEYSIGTISIPGNFVSQETLKFSYTYTREGLPATLNVANRVDTYNFKFTYEEF